MSTPDAAIDIPLSNLRGRSTPAPAKSPSAGRGRRDRRADRRATASRRRRPPPRPRGGHDDAVDCLFVRQTRHVFERRPLLRFHQQSWMTVPCTSGRPETDQDDCPRVPPRAALARRYAGQGVSSARAVNVHSSIGLTSAENCRDSLNATDHYAYYIDPAIAPV